MHGEAYAVARLVAAGQHGDPGSAVDAQTSPREAIGMKKLIIGAAVFVAALAALRRFGPALGRRAMKKCGEMFDRMPEESPPKQMMRGIEEIRKQNARILREVAEEHRRQPLADAVRSR
jgi:hypothetical protein